MKRKGRLVAVFLICAVLLAGIWMAVRMESLQRVEPQPDSLYSASVDMLSIEEEQLYDRIVMTLLEEDLWTPRDMYDACECLMIPMHYAFRAGKEEAIDAFASFFHRFITDIGGEDRYEFSDQGILNRLQFYYLCTQFMVLCKANGCEEKIPAGLAKSAEDFASAYLLEHVANWNTEPTVIEHLRQVLAGKEYKYSYYSVVEDLDGYTLAILCDLRVLGLGNEETTQTAAELAYKLYSSPSLNEETQEGGWLFQVGAWKDHPDYAYAGNEKITETIQPLQREDIPWDSSHFSRYPLWLLSYQSAQDSEEKCALFRLRREQLANQMMNCVLNHVDGWWLTTTFMDGTNGVYRYGYHEDGVGIQGYDLSGTFLYGWWAALGDERLTSVYQDILEKFPLEGGQSNPYFDHATVREQNPYFDMDTAFELGTFECMVMCAARL